MKKKNYSTILGVMIFLSLISIVSAAPPVNTIFTGDTGIQVEVNIMPEYKQGEARWSIIHLSNVTTGFQITNTTHDNISCHLHLREGQGFEIMNVEATPDEDHWDLNGSGGSANPLGSYAWTITCQDLDSEVGGYASGYFNITPTGSEFTTQQAILYGFILILLGVFLYFTIYGIRNAESAEWLIGYICLSYIVLYLVVSELWILATNYLYGIPMLGNILYMAWLIMGFGFLPFIFIISLYILGEEARAALEEGYLKQGYSKEEARDLSKKNKR